MTTFVVIGVVGLLVLLTSFVLGDVLEGVFNALTGDIFSSAVIGGFVAAFGFGAALVQGLVGSTLVASLVGVGAGVLAAAFTLWLTRLVRDGSSDATLAADDALGRSGRVIGHIPPEGYGSVRLAIGGHTVQLNAKADVALDPGTEVHVTEILSPTAVRVAPVWDVLPEPDR
jgi:hypothetical protein